jgi:predicted nuclease of predicted toxin-antitoxin system
LRLLLDEMISPRIARKLRKRGFDVQAIKGDRPDLETVADLEIVRRMATERRAVVTNDIIDFQLIHNQLATVGEAHSGVVFTFDDTMPRNKASVSLWVRTLSELLKTHPEDDALRNRILHLP